MVLVSSIKELHAQVEKLTRFGKNPQLLQVKERLAKAIVAAGSNTALRIKIKKVGKVESTGVEQVKKPTGTVTRKLPVKAPAATSTSGPVSASALKAVPFKRIELHGRFKKDICRLNSDTQVMVWGSPGEGKTGYCLLLADSLARHSGLKVLYVAAEEFGRSTFSEKLKDLASAGTPVDHPNLFFHGSIDVDCSAYGAVVIDSVQEVGMDLPAYKEWAKKYPGVVKVIVVQSTKDGDFRGGKDWEHEVDVAGQVINRKLSLRKNRLDPSLSQKKEKQGKLKQAA